MARPKKTKVSELLDSESLDALILLLERGVPTCHACVVVGVAQRTLTDWLQRGRAGEEPFADLAVRVEVARAAGVAGLYSKLRDHAEVDYRAAHWLITRLESEEDRQLTRQRNRTAAERERLALQWAKDDHEEGGW